MQKRKCSDALSNRIFEIISEISVEIAMPSYIVGGFVRDYLLGIKNDDIDIVVEGSGIDFAKSFSNKIGGKLYYYENYGTAMVKYNDLEIEFVGARKEMYERGSRKPIVEKGTLYDDISRRDFTINTLAISLNKHNYGELIDYFNGISDLDNKIIRTPLDPNITFSDDTLRIFRAIRFATKLKDFIIEEKTKEAIINNRDRIKILSRERITGEIEKMLTYFNIKKGLSLIQSLGLWKYAFLSENKTINIDLCSNTYPINLRWFLLAENYSDNYLLFTKQMKLPNALADKLIKYKYVYDRMKDVIYPSIPVIRHCLNFAGFTCFQVLELILEYKTCVLKWDRCDAEEWFFKTFAIFMKNKDFMDFKILDGNTIAKYADLNPGKELGNLIKEIKEEILNGLLNNTEEDICLFIKYKKLLKKYDRKNKIEI